MSNVKLLQAILDKVKSMDNKVDEVKQELEKTETRLTSRIDKLGLQIANFEDDAPTIGEFDKLEKRVSKLENQIAKN